MTHKTFNLSKTFRTRFDKIDGFIKIYDGTSYCLALKSMILFTVELNIA